MNRFFFAGYVGEGAKCMLEDVSDLENVTLIDNVFDNKAIRYIYYNMIGDKRNPLLLRLLFPFYTLTRQLKSFDEGVVIYFNSGFKTEYNAEFVAKLKKKYPKYKHVLYIVDPIPTFGYEENQNVIDEMDLVYCINEKDALERGYRYFPLIYSKCVKEESNLSDKDYDIDLYYLGSGDDRTSKLCDIANLCETNGLRSNLFVLSGDDKTENGIHFLKKPINYGENIKNINKANCLLEIMHAGYNNPTQRYAEAVVYNKKLLSDNPNIVNFDFYNSENMKIFNKFDTDVISFIKDDKKVDYGYAGEFSPVEFIGRVENDLNNIV